MTRVLIVGGKGVIGSLVIKEIGAGHEIVTAGRSSGDIRVNISNASSIQAMFKQLGKIDILVCAAGQSAFGPIDGMDEDQFHAGIDNKLLGQINLVRYGVPFVKDGGVIVLTSGCTNVQPVKNGSFAGMINGGLEAFVTVAAVDMPRGIRINCVSPGVVRENSAQHMHKFPGSIPVEGCDVAKAYHRCIATGVSGTVERVL